MKSRHFVVAVLSSLFFLTTIGQAAEEDVRTVNDGNVELDGVPEVPAWIGDKLSRYQNTRGAGFQDWAEDGGIYISTRFGETSQIHHVAGPGAARRQLTFFAEPVGGASRQPGGSLLGFAMDEGGAENHQLYVLDPETGDHRMLTDGSSRNGAPAWSDDGQQIAWQSTRRNGRSNDVWLMNIDEPEKARMIVESGDGTWWGPADWSADGHSLLIQQYVSVTDSRIHVLDLESGELELVAGGEDNPGTNFAGEMAAGGFYLVTDAFGEFRTLAFHDFSTGEVEPITRDLAWDVGGFDLSADGSRAVFDVNEDGIDTMYLLDPETREYRRVDGLPIGLVGGFSFSSDGRALGMTLNTSTSPSDAFSLELGDDPLAVDAITRWTTSEIGGLDTSTFVTPELIRYPTFDRVDGEHRQIPAFVYTPPGEGPHPVLISIHGGPEAQFRPSFRADFQMFIGELGVAVIAPNVRGSTGYGKEYVKLDNGFLREDSVKDIGALLDWIETRPELDASRVAVYGGSYGGYMVLASMMHYSDRLAAGVDIVGISNFVTFLENTKSYRRDLRRVEYGDERDPEMRAHLEKISPSNHADKLTAPLFVAQGQNDPRVPVSEAEQIVAEVRKAGYDVWYMNALNEGHGFRKKENRDLYQEIVTLFLTTHLSASD